MGNYREYAAVTESFGKNRFDECNWLETSQSYDTLSRFLKRIIEFYLHWRHIESWITII